MLEFASAGSAAAMLGAGVLNTNARRPFFDENGHACVIVNGKAVRTNAPASLRYDEWKDIDRKVIAIATDRLTGVADLISGGLVHTLGSVGQTVSLWDRSSDMTPANTSMDGVSKGEEDAITFETQSVPVPIIHKDFRLNMRRLEASRLMGEGVDTITAQTAARLVAEKSEDMLFSGDAIKVDGATIYGYRTHPHRNTVDLAENWDATGTTGQDILDDVQAMLAAARADRYFGPFTLYIPGAYQGALDADFAPASGDTRTVRQRIMQLEGIAAIKVSDRLTANNVILVQMTADVVDMAIAQDVTTVQWDVDGGMVKRFKVMAVWVPRVKSDHDGKSGVVHLRPA